MNGFGMSSVVFFRSFGWCFFLFFILLLTTDDRKGPYLSGKSERLVMTTIYSIVPVLINELFLGTWTTETKRTEGVER